MFYKKTKVQKLRKECEKKIIVFLVNYASLGNGGSVKRLVSQFIFTVVGVWYSEILPSSENESQKEMICSAVKLGMEFGMTHFSSFYVTEIST
ncbi:CLUMA_CG001726, isoform A [Clunio marinus]|uniref:CLUMA_CG001726, isoform A n=1 Tax=Clunio marinus TaxID=568069 RepID=A0A1J1HKK2_9DIPT|nr:CLUMA_CG001726, isoform A [Clunio marinus]